MTPKEKASSLAWKFSYKIYSESGDLPGKKAIECALIAVDEVLNSNPFEWVGNWQSTVDYWEEVKQELNNL